MSRIRYTVVNDSTQPKARFWRNKAAYVLGALILWVGTFGTQWQSSSTIPEVKLAWGLVMGAAMWTFFLVPQIIVQFVVRKLVKRWMQLSLLVETVILNIPVAVFAAFLCASAYAASSPSARFQKYFGSPVPPTVRKIQQGGSTGVDGVFWVLRLNIDRADIEMILKQLQLVPVGDEKSLHYWQLRIQTRAGITFDLQPPFESYSVGDQRTERRLFYDSKTSVAYFVYCTYLHGA